MHQSAKNGFHNIEKSIEKTKVSKKGKKTSSLFNKKVSLGGVNTKSYFLFKKVLKNK